MPLIGEQTCRHTHWQAASTSTTISTWRTATDIQMVSDSDCRCGSCLLAYAVAQESQNLNTSTVTNSSYSTIEFEQILCPMVSKS